MQEPRYYRRRNVEPTRASFTDWLSNLSIVQILCAVVLLTAIRLISVRLLTKAGKPPSKGLSRSAVEIADSLIYAFAIAFLLIKPLVAQPFYVPTGSMEPTLRGDNKGTDRVWVDKINYRFHSPKHGDVVVFIPPARATAGENLDSAGPVHFIKRMIAAGGDKIEVTAGEVTIKGAIYTHREIREGILRKGIFGKDDVPDQSEFMAVDHVKFVTNGVLANGKLVTKEQLAQIYAGSPAADVQVRPGYVSLNGKKLDEPYTAEDPDYDLKLVDGKPLKYDHGSGGYRYDGVPIDDLEARALASKPAEVVPKGEYFMMGDNRNDSLDSTEWGALPAKRVVGKADAIFWPIDRVNWSL